jgi:hypothetical protein
MKMTFPITGKTVEVWRHINSGWQDTEGLYALMTNVEPRVDISFMDLLINLRGLVEAGIVEVENDFEPAAAKYRVTERDMTEAEGDLACALNRIMDATGGDYAYGKENGGVVG